MQDAYAADADRAFRDHPKIDVLYEELSQKRQDTPHGVFTFLGVPDVPVTTQMRKQNLETPWECVDNYDQLKAHFRHSKWSAFFE
jgi:hypothetical protein